MMIIANVIFGIISFFLGIFTFWYGYEKIFVQIYNLPQISYYTAFAIMMFISLWHVKLLSKYEEENYKEYFFKTVVYRIFVYLIALTVFFFM